MHIIFESLESDFKRALIDTKISQIACWEHIEPKNTIHCIGAGTGGARGAQAPPRFLVN